MTPSREAVKQIRRSLGLSQKAFAEQIGVSKSTIGMIECGSNKISNAVWERIVRLATAVPDLAKEALSSPAQDTTLASAPAAETMSSSSQDTTLASTPAVSIHIQSIDGHETTPEAIIASVGDADRIYVRVDQNAAYWVRGDETGKVELW